MKRVTAAACVALLGIAPLRSEPGLREQVQRLIAASGAEVAVAFRTLDGGEELLIAPDMEFHAASTMKVPIMIELFRQAGAGSLALDDAIPVTNEFHSIVDGTVYRLDPGDDSDSDVYKHIGGRMSYRELCEAMITVSSNLAANLLLEKLGVENVQRTISRLGADGMHLLRGVEDDKAFQRGLNNTTTARALLTLMDKIAQGAAADGRGTDEMLGILERQRVNGRIPAGIPPGIPIAHKTGEITRIRHDAAIVYAPRPFVLVVLVRGMDEGKKADALIASIAKTVYRGLAGRAGLAGQAGRAGLAGQAGM